MTELKLKAAAGALAILLGMAAMAHAEPVRTPVDPGTTFTLRDAFAPDLNQWGAPVGRRTTLQWDSKKAKWGLKLDLDQPAARPLNYTDSDLRAGAFYKITPSFRVGGAVSLGAVGDPQPAITPDRAPKVRLETSFKF